MTSFSLRPASEHDEDSIFETFELAMRQYVEWAWGWDERTQRGNLLEALPIRNFRLICVNGEAVGAIAVEESPQRDHPIPHSATSQSRKVCAAADSGRLWRVTR